MIGLGGPAAVVAATFQRAGTGRHLCELADNGRVYLEAAFSTHTNRSYSKQFSKVNVASRPGDRHRGEELRMARAEDWKDTLDELARRRDHSRAMGGAERLAKHHGKGKLDARARIDHLLDKGTFREFGTLVGGDIAADGIVAGSGLINGSPVMVGAEDFTTLAGSIGPGGNSKRYRLAELALRDRIPLVMLLEGAGFRPSGEHYGRTPTDLLAQAQCSGKVPTVGGLFGPSAGHGALVAPVCDFTIMSRQGAIFTAGPPVVKESTGEEISKEDLGGPSVAMASGVIHNLAEDDEAVLDDIRRYLSYFPSSAWSYPASLPADESTAPSSDPRTARHRARAATVGCTTCARCSTSSSTTPTGSRCSRSSARPSSARLPTSAGIRSRWWRINRRCMAGSIDADAADKAAHFITVADSFHLPIVFLADNPGMLPGSRSETQRRAAQRRADVRGADRGDDAEAASDAAQGLRVRVDGDVTARIRRPGRDIRLSGRDDGCDERRRAEPGLTRRRGCRGQAAQGRGRGVVPVSGSSRLRRPHRPGGDQGRAAVDALERGIYSRQAAAEPVSRTVITP